MDEGMDKWYGYVKRYMDRWIDEYRDERMDG